MSKSRDNKHRRQRAAKKLAEWRLRNSFHQDVTAQVEIVAVQGQIPKAR